MSNVFKRGLLAGVAAVALALPATAMADVKIGFLGGFTGPIESLTPPIADAAKLAATQINDIDALRLQLPGLVGHRKGR